MEYVTLNNDVKMPMEGFGVFQVSDPQVCEQSVYDAITEGYRLIDTAEVYGNEEEVGQAIRDSGIPREEVFVTSKLWLQDYGYEQAKVGIARSLRKLGIGYIDLYLIHQPYGDVPGAWKAMEEAKGEGKLRSIGVSNMTPNIWNKFVPQFATKPSVNQVECNPFCQQRELRQIMAQADVKLECYFPLGHGNPELLGNEVITNLADKYSKNPGQIILRFEIQDGLIVLPKSVNSDRINGNIDIFDFELTSDEMEKMRTLDTGKRSHDPDAPGVEEMLRSAFVIED